MIARLAWRSHGVVTRERLLDSNVTSAQIRARIRRGSLIVEYPGVYRVGHRAPSIAATYTAAVLACGEGALLMGLAAAHLYGLTKGDVPSPVVKTRIDRCIDGVETHRSRMQAQGTLWLGIPITTVSQTLIDVARSLPFEQLVRACHEADVKYGVTAASFGRGIPRKLRAALEGGIPVTLSALEARFLDLLAAERLPVPVTNRPRGAYRVDCHWPAHRLTVELDSYRFHRTRHAWEQDRRRERDAHARGDHHRRYTYGDVFDDPRAMLAELRVLLGAAGRR
jgi:very-short-patch-repair endonuclease